MTKLGGESASLEWLFIKLTSRLSVVEIEYFSNRSKPQLPRFAIMRNHNERGYL